MAAEQWDIELKLINGGLVGPAKQSADVLRALEQQMDRTSSAFEDALNGKVKGSFDESKKAAKGFGDEVQKAIQQAARLSADPKGYQLLQKAKKDLADQRRNLLGLDKKDGFADEVKRAHDELKKLNSDPKGYKELIKARKELSKRKSNLSTEDGGFGKGFFGWAQPYGAGRVGSELVGHLGAQAIIGAIGLFVAGIKKSVDIISDGVKSAFREGSQYESLKLGYKLSLKGTEAEDSMQDVGRFSKMTGFDDDVINRWLLPLRRAGFDRQGARTAFAAASDIAAGQGKGGDQGFVQGLLENFTNIKLKGGIQERRLPELGVDVKQFYSDLAKTLKTTTDAAKKLAEEGKVNPQVLLNTIYKGVEARQGGKLGTGGIAYGKTMQARLSKLEDLPNQYFKAVAESPRWNELSDKFGSLLEQLDPDSPKGKRIVDSIMRAFGTLSDVAERVFTPENIDAFVDGMVKVVDLSEQLMRVVAPILNAAIALATKGPAGSSKTTKATDYYKDGKISVLDFSPYDKVPKSVPATSDLAPKGSIAGIDLSPYMKGPSIAAATKGAVNAPVNVNVNVGAGVDANNAKQVGQTVGDEAGRAAALHIGRVRDEAGT